MFDINFCLYVCCLVDIVCETQQMLEPFEEQRQSQLLLALLKRLIFRPFFEKTWP